METLIKKISTKLIEGDFDVQSEMLWKIETAFRKAKDEVQDKFPLIHPDFPEGVEYSVRRNPIPKAHFINWEAKIKLELEQQGFVQVSDGKNVVELHTPENSVYYNYNNGEILIYQK